MSDHDADEDALGRERFRMWLEDAGFVVRPTRIIWCATCRRPWIVLPPPDIEVITEEYLAALKRIAETLGATVPEPYSDPADGYPPCRHCGTASGG